ncbi:hypothetical protein [Kitasatospora sp. DSM 101779]|uniref:hypothetical protein n=1 Tax=Kitasatospora sp. DSM 101779 TaxID=2853165 RepID=UPI0021DA3522|nr:hypothetical protein [Kitasatospora sp. DSM 101779]MCU7820190.1 hypothetical protein [Kitasatospora sp. DSM 101779]
MKITTKIALGIAVVVGYVLGRLKKGRWALALATYFAGRRLDPRELATEALRKLGDEVPEVAKFTSAFMP